MFSLSLDQYTAFLGFSTGYVVYSLCLVIYRVYFSPLSHIPGPKIAIATSWYECYYDVWKRGLYYEKVREFHRVYGPIVRISPHEVHIDDPSYYDELYNNSHKWDKYAPYMAQFNSPGAVISTAHHDLHRLRRKLENNFFSRRSIVALEPLIHSHLNRLYQRLQDFQSNGKPLTVNHAMLCFTSDVVSEYAFGESWSLLEDEGFAPWLLSANKKTGELSHTMKQWPWLVHVLNVLPTSWISLLTSDVGRIFRYQNIAQQNVIRIQKQDSHDSKSKRTIIGSLLDSPELPASEKSTFRLTKESFTIVAAGGDTTGSTISVIMFHLIANPDKLSKLRAALAPLFPNPAHIPTWKQLEDTPYMTAVVKEGLRINQGVISRIPRCAPDRDTTYKAVRLPRGTPVSMSIPDIHENTDLFPEPKTFSPERWLDFAGEDGKERLHSRLDRWLVPFTKGSRQCLGMNLAYAEIYLSLATLFMRFDFELYHTTREDVDWRHDFTVPHPRLGSKLCRVLVKERN